MTLILIPPITLEGHRAAESWLRNIAPDRQERTHRHYDEAVKRLEAALSHDKDLLRAFRSVNDDAQFFGRVDGLKEGMKLYKYALQIEKRRKQNPAWHSMLRYIVGLADRHKEEKLRVAVSAPEVCKHLDKQIDRIKSASPKRSDAAAQIKPPVSWGCATWTQALQDKENRSKVDKLVSEARSEALSEQYCTLQAWRTWGAAQRPEPES
jgi:hypothetical protein